MNGDLDRILLLVGEDENIGNFLFIHSLRASFGLHLGGKMLIDISFLIYLHETCFWVLSEFNNLDMATRFSEQVNNKMATLSISDDSMEQDDDNLEEDVLDSRSYPRKFFAKGGLRVWDGFRSHGKVHAFVGSITEYFAPNLCAVFGSEVASKLIVGTAGGLSALANMILASWFLAFQYVARNSTVAALVDWMRGDPTDKTGRCIRDEIIRVSEQWQKKSYLAAKQGSELDPLPIFKPKGRKDR
ncbi:hypothetical protein RHSIM_Rhsim06G0228300 [Rhododendron simsii]|uniref:Nop domain-containing protein n=1 Tax=Rhododendron simsii TaxID=118357 RepID=A0A834LMT4_RHOSS|nr:hypothetical protein RHSIM_Rhsim06G0228300 [Rhododendron simsii]